MGILHKETIEINNMINASFNIWKSICFQFLNFSFQGYPYFYVRIQSKETELGYKNMEIEDRQTYECLSLPSITCMNYEDFVSITVFNRERASFIIFFI